MKFPGLCKGGGVENKHLNTFFCFTEKEVAMEGERDKYAHKYCRNTG